MYTRYAERRHWKTEMMEINDTGLGGIKEAVILIKGKGAYSSSNTKAARTECRECLRRNPAEGYTHLQPRWPYFLRWMMWKSISTPMTSE